MRRMLEKRVMYVHENGESFLRTFAYIIHFPMNLDEVSQLWRERSQLTPDWQRNIDEQMAAWFPE